MTAQKNLLIDASLCTGCRMCELVCSMVKEKETNPSKSRIFCEFYMMEGLRFPRVCVNCLHPACIDACPTGALYKDETTGYTLYNRDDCTNCEACIDACSYGAIRLDPDGEIIKCNLCGGDPECVKVCETHAIRFGDRQPQQMTKARKGMIAHYDEVAVEA
jgi:carbon-monoxide dehydrogenase iron sulfur subunit